MKYIACLLLLFGLWACGGSTYDQLELYSPPSSKAPMFFRSADSLKMAKKLEAIRHGFAPESLAETHEFIKDLKLLGIKKEQIPSTKFGEINKVLFKPFGKIPSTESINDYPSYYTILVFKKEGEIVGVMKICPGCYEHYAVGIENQIRYFGLSEDYEKLNELLR